ncbi:PGAP1-like protein [Pseudomonas frederiksbergensis]|uniref:PGAP1-like protein n=1 Tax=Pseudomonas frederiksbergensis TaxID=104087 RepID=A0A1H4VE74_9PSED|nr:ABC-three component system protein [Pseudomonas frederiksbergensis]SEC79277.1 PGAP1-like protein [Pseudomonas frederiksbergensis]
MKKIGVVFVHGFTGGENTWKNADGEKFSDLLKQDAGLANRYDFFEFDYFTKLISIYHSAPVQRVLGLIGFGKNRVRSNKPIKQLSESLDAYIRTRLEDYEHVILIAHSMGGLIAKDYILNYEEGNGPQPTGYISIAVPHKGSLGSVLLAPTMNVNAKEMQPLSDYGDALNSEWTHRKEELPRCMYIVALHDECVPVTSSIPFTVNKSEKFTFSHDHLSICKPNGPEDLVYMRVKSFLSSLAHDHSMNELAATTFDPDLNEYDKEIFVIKMILSGIGEMGIEDAKASFFHAEIISKAADQKDRIILVDLQNKVLGLYRQTFNEHFASSEGNEIFSEVHRLLLDQDAKVLESGVKYINFIHKKGLLQQLANKLNRHVIWSNDVTTDHIQDKM